jgi:hypothetical protein
MYTEAYEKLHAEYLEVLLQYHNAYVKYIKGNRARVDYPIIRKSLREMKAINQLMIKEILKVRKGKMESNKDKYQTHRQKENKHVNNNRSNQRSSGSVGS